MTRLLVRCCCQPQKVLGSLPWPLPHDPQPGDRMHFAIRGGETVMLSVGAYAEVTLGADGEPQRHKEFAYKSEETPLERLRLIPSFTVEHADA
jgi:hypothetical protein